MRRTKTAPKAPITQPAQKLPEWVKDTPVMEYTLEASPSDGGIEQRIEMSLSEYDALKRHLARLRGIAPAGDAR